MRPQKVFSNAHGIREFVVIVDGTTGTKNANKATPPIRRMRRMTLNLMVEPMAPADLRLSRGTIGSPRVARPRQGSRMSLTDGYKYLNPRDALPLESLLS